MGMDNVLAIAGASSGHLGLVILGLLISIPLVVWGSTLILKLIGRFPVIMYVGAGAIVLDLGEGRLKGLDGRSSDPGFQCKDDRPKLLYIF